MKSKEMKEVLNFFTPTEEEILHFMVRSKLLVIRYWILKNFIQTLEDILENLEEVIILTLAEYGIEGGDRQEKQVYG